MSSSNPEASPGSFVRRSAALNALFVSEGAANFLLDVVLATSIGLSTQSDILYAAWSLPLTIGRGMFQSLTNSFMGLFVDREDRGRSYNQAITVVLVIGAALAALMALTAPIWFPWTVPGITAEARAAGAPLAAILAWLIAFLAVAETLRAIYYRENRLPAPSVARVIGNGLTIGVALLSAPSRNLVWVSIGIVAGAALEALLSLIGLPLLLGIRYRPDWPDRRFLGEMIHQVGTPMLGQGVRVAAGVVERALASLLGPGALTAVSFAGRIAFTIERFVFRGFLIATIQSYAKEARRDLTPMFRLVTLISLPLAVALLALAEPIVGIVYGRGRFTPENAAMLAATLQTYSLVLLTIAITRIPLGLAYAQKQSRVVLLFFVSVSVVMVGLEALFIRLGLGMGLFGLATAAGMLLGFFWLVRFSVLPAGIRLWTRQASVEFLTVGAGALAATVLSALIIGRWTTGFPLANWAILLGSGLACLGALLLGMRLLHMQEYRWLMGLVKGARR